MRFRLKRVRSNLVTWLASVYTGGAAAWRHPFGSLKLRKTLRGYTTRVDRRPRRLLSIVSAWPGSFMSGRSPCATPVRAAAPEPAQPAVGARLSSLTQRGETAGGVSARRLGPVSAAWPPRR